jgi:hypothetical protein
VLVFVFVIVFMRVVAAGMRMTHDAQDARKTLLQHLGHSGIRAPASWPRTPLAAAWRRHLDKRANRCGGRRGDVAHLSVLAGSLACSPAVPSRREL